MKYWVVWVASILCLNGCRTGIPNSGSPPYSKDNMEIYHSTRNEPGHEFVKTEQFAVPVGAVVEIRGLEFAPGLSELTAEQQLIVRQIFNSLEELTENVYGDTNKARVAEFSRMEFGICVHSTDSGNAEENLHVSEARAKAVFDLLTNLGTPAWRLHLNQGEFRNRAEIQPANRVLFVRLR